MKSGRGGDINMLRAVLLFSVTCGLVKSSGVAVAPLPLAGSSAPIGSAIASLENAPFVTAASSQYFQRTFNRLVVPPVIAPVAPPPVAPTLPLPLPAPVPTVFVEPTRTVPAVVTPQPQPSILPQEPIQPNIAVAIATAHAAAPVATILLPPYPFGFPPTFGFVPSGQPTSNPDENNREPTTQRTTETEAITTPEPARTTPVDTSSSDNSFVQALPSNENVNFNLYGPPPQGSRPQFQPLPQSQGANGQIQPQTPNFQFQPQSPNLQFHPRRPNPQLQPQQPNPQFQVQQQNPQFQGQQPNPPFQLQRPNSQFQPKQPNLQIQPQKPNMQFQHQRPNPQFQLQQPEFPPYPPLQQPQQQNTPQQQPQLQPPSQYLPAKQQPWKQQNGRPQKIKTSVEVVPVPLAYITPPPLHKTHSHVKILKHVYSYVPASRSKIILKHVKVRPVRLVKHKAFAVRLQNLRANDRDIEITTLNPFRRSNTKPPRV